jgi:hypothetical protein
VYGVRGDRLIIANPLNPSRTCESVPRTAVEAAWNGQLWQVELIQKQEKFGLKWFLPAVWRYRKLLGEVLLASFTLQLFGLATPVITQVIIDKVLVQESLSTLDVMAIALLGLPYLRRFWASYGYLSLPTLLAALTLVYLLRCFVTSCGCHWLILNHVALETRLHEYRTPKYSGVSHRHNFNSDFG